MKQRIFQTACLSQSCNYIFTFGEISNTRFTLKAGVCKWYVALEGSRHVGETTARPYPSRPRSSRNVVRRMTGYRRARYTGRTVRHVGASHTCSVRTRMRIVISGSPAAALSTCCPQADRATDTGPAPVRPFPMFARTSFFFVPRRSFFGTRSRRCAVCSRDTFVNCDQIQKESLILCLFRHSVPALFVQCFIQRNNTEIITILMKSLTFQHLSTK